tara:strand:- start:548 stop:1291 length:744 start_codon:yes stop_codon:yes gene_type:complete
MIQGIILTAGRGSRLGHLTEKKPKSFNKSGKRRYIDIIIDNFVKNNIKKINIIVGYKKNLFEKIKCNKIYNRRWGSSNIFYSLNKAKKILKLNTCIVSYSDIIYDKEAIKLLIKESGDIVILNNTNWKKIWKIRFKNPLDDLENFDYFSSTSGNFLTKIGGKAKSMSLIKGQFAGLFKVSPHGWKIISEFIKTNKIDINNLDITSFFSKLLKKNKKIIKVVNYNKSWFEIDTLRDYKNYKIYKRKKI